MATFRDRYVLQRNAALETFGDDAKANVATGSRQPNISVEWATDYWSEWSKTAILWGKQTKLTANPYNIGQFDAELQRFRDAEDAMEAPGPDGKLIADPTLFWKRISALALTMDALGAAPSELTTDLEILGGALDDTGKALPGAVINGALAIAARAFGTLAPWLLAAGAIYLVAKRVEAG